MCIPGPLAYKADRRAANARINIGTKSLLE